MQWLAAVCVRRPVFATVLMLLVLVVGIAGYTKLGLDEFPNIDFPIIIVTTRLPGGAPEEIESDVTDKIESAVSTISGIDELNSRSSEGVSLVVIGFTLEKSVDVAAQDVRDHINLVLPQLPKGIDPPIVSKVDPDAVPVLIVAMKSKRSIRETTEIADKSVRRQIESINGVGEVNLVGGRKRQVNIWLNPLALQARGLSAADVQRAIAAQNMTTPGGSVETGPQNLTLRVEGRVDSPEAVGRIVVREVNGHAVRVEDVARVEDSQEEERSYAQLDDDQTVVLSIKKQSGTNTVAVVDAVKARLGTVQATLPDDVKLKIVRDNSGIIRTGIGAVKEHLVVGAVLAALVVLVFLGNFRSTIIAAVAIPISIIGTFGLMWIQGFTLNFLTLLALALAVGIVIDDAIVVLENIIRYIEVKKTKPFPAAVLATREIGLAVLATTLSLMAVFLPVALMSGIVGRFLKSFGMTMAFAIFVSLIVSFSLTPALSARWLRAVRRPCTIASRALRRRLLSAHRARVHGDAALGDAAPVGHRERLLRHARLVHSAHQQHPQGLFGPRRSRPVRGQRPRTRGDERHFDAPHHRAHRARHPATTRGHADAAHRRRRRPANAQSRPYRRGAQRSQRARHRTARADGSRPQRDLHQTAPRIPHDGRRGFRDFHRRVLGLHLLRTGRARPRETRRVRHTHHRRLAQGPRRGRRRQLAHRR